MSVKLEPIFSFAVGISEPEVIGETPEGLRANYYLTGGNATGDRVTGKFLPVGGDWVCEPLTSVKTAIHVLWSATCLLARSLRAHHPGWSLPTHAIYGSTGFTASGWVSCSLINPRLPTISFLFRSSRDA